MNLKQTQELFWQAARNEATPEAICACFEGDTQLSAIGRMKIYSNAFFSRQLSALSKFLPKTEGLLQDEFSRLGREYVVRAPGVDAPLESFPQHFAAFLEEKGRYSEAAALARLELARNRSLLAPEEAPVFDTSRYAIALSDVRPTRDTTCSRGAFDQERFPNIWRTRQGLRRARRV